MKNPYFSVLLALSLSPPAQAMGSSPTLVHPLIPSAKVDFARDLASLPLHLGHLRDGRNVWFVLTDTNDAATAKRLGLEYAAKLTAVLDEKSTRQATIDAKGDFTFERGTVDFRPKQALIPGDAPNFFPPKSARPGSVGDADYSPFVRIEGTNIVYNAPIVAFDVTAEQISFCGGQVDYDRVHDRVANICPASRTVGVKLGHGFASGQPVVYLSFDSNDALPATMESSTYTPATQDLVTSEARSTLYAFVNGPTGVNNPDRQGFDSALSGEGSPLNILDGLTPASSGYTPLWDVNATVWTARALNAGERHRLTSGSDVANAASTSLLTNPMGQPVGSSGLLVNCPVLGFVK